MAMLTRKRAKEAAETAAPSGGDAPTKRKLRENERLRSVLKESTFGAAVETLEHNIRFRLTPDAAGNPRWLALLLRAEDIGGLSEKTKRDEAKGSLVQQIISDQIEAIATADMLDRECFAIVPSASTLERMGEYSLLTNAQYYWVVFSSAGGDLVFDQNIGPATYAQALAIQNGGSLQESVLEGDGGADTWARIEIGGAGAAADTQADAAAAGVATREPLATQAIDTVDDDEIFGDVAVAEAVAHAEPSVQPVEDIEAPDFDPELDDPSDFFAALDASDSGEASDGSDDLFDDLADLPEGDDEVFVPDDAETSVEGGAPEAVYGDEKTPYTEYLDQNASREFTEQ
jgi:hypothetical protein